ncbi:hypothetical protein R1flu_003488 [Riccia fluitans]|uniref:Uncharacterized protein n=1 Tax=Riccia fluitans TaxID=41844 RepID=A0ABD1Y996_9MARC
MDPLSMETGRCSVVIEKRGDVSFFIEHKPFLPFDVLVAEVNPGVIVQLPELTDGSQFYKLNQSVRVCGMLESLRMETGIAIISHGGARLRVDRQYLREGSLFQFIGELIQDHSYTCLQLMLQARVARNADALNMDLYEKTLQLRRQFERKYLPNIFDLFFKDIK